MAIRIHIPRSGRNLFPVSPLLRHTSTTQTSRISRRDSSTMLQSCVAKRALDKAEGPSLGFFQVLPGSNVSRAIARAGGDWVMIDCEHGNIDDAAMHEAVPAVASCGVSPLVRIPGMEGWMIKRALDAGAHGILVPLLRTAEEAKKIVAEAKFPPLGQRGFGSPFSYDRFSPMPTMTEYLQQANDALLTMVQIETKEALDAVDEIASVPGIDLVFVGPFDLGNNIGHPILNNVWKPELEQAVDKILEAAHRAGKKAGFFAVGVEQARKYADKGFDMISVGIDVGALQYSLAAHLNAVKRPN